MHLWDHGPRRGSGPGMHLWDRGPSQDSGPGMRMGPWSRLNSGDLQQQLSSS